MLANHLTVRHFDGEEEAYILTEEEEKLIIDNAIISAKDHFTFVRLQLGEPLAQINQKVSTTDWKKEIDFKAILKTCNSSKHSRLWEKENRKKEKEEELRKEKELLDTHTANFFFKMMSTNSREFNGKRLIVNDDTKKLITVICFFMSRDSRFETELGYSFSKGLLIRGISGLGKTFLFELVSKNLICPIKIYSLISISESIKDEGVFNIPTHFKNKIYLDDVGTEQPVINHYGTKITFFKDFIETFYLQNKSFDKLIISTNNSSDELEAKYGFRVRSRLREMFNVVDLKGSDMRK